MFILHRIPLSPSQKHYVYPVGEYKACSTWQQCYNPRNRNANFSKSHHGPIFKFLWWFVKWFHENGTNPSTGELFDPYKPLYKPFQQKNKWPDGLFYIGPSVVARLTMTTFFGNSARINKAWQKRVFKNEFKKGKVEMEYLPWRFINIKASLPFLKTPINSECINIALEDWSNDW